MPYGWLEKLIPQLSLSGVPARMMVMTTLALSVIASMALATLTTRWPRLAMLLVAVSAIEYWPAPMTTTASGVPDYVHALANLPPGSVIDLTDASPPWLLYYQTIHQKPIAFGYVSRVPKSVQKFDIRLRALINLREFSSLSAEFKFRYVALPRGETLPFAQVYADSSVRILDIQAQPAQGK